MSDTYRDARDALREFESRPIDGHSSASRASLSRLSGYRRALGCAGVAAVGSDRGLGVGAGRRPVPGRQLADSQARVGPARRRLVG